MSISALVIKDFQKALFCCVWECVCMCGCREGDEDRKRERSGGLNGVCVWPEGEKEPEKGRCVWLSVCLYVCLTSFCMCV